MVLVFMILLKVFFLRSFDKIMCFLLIFYFLFNGMFIFDSCVRLEFSLECRFFWCNRGIVDLKEEEEFMDGVCVLYWIVGLFGLVMVMMLYLVFFINCSLWW